MKKISRAGLAAAALYAVPALAALAAHLYSAATNPADSGESGILMLPFALPWVLLVPDAVAYSSFWAFAVYPFYLFSVALNSAILYRLAAGILRLFTRRRD